MPTKRLVEDLSRVSTREIIGKTVETYPPDWIVIHETLQNALDAVQKSHKHAGSIRVSLDLDSGEVEIKDNGIGFPHKLNLLGFGGSDKGPTDWRVGGEIGVGLKVVIFSSERFQLNATYTDEGTGSLRNWTGQITNGYR